jgi:hypothetical protein
MAKALKWLGLTILGAIIAIFVAAGVPVVIDHVKQFTGPGSWQPTGTDWNPVQQTTIQVDSGGVLQLTTPAGYMRWFGAYLPRPRLCDYRLSLDARSGAGPAGALSGYGIAPGITVAADGVPQGEGVQYDLGFGALRYPDYPYDTADNQSGFIDPVRSFLDGTRIPVNGQWHHWIIIVSGTTATVNLDNHQAPSMHPAAGCAGGIYLRVWNGTAYFRDITISKA